MGKDKRGVLRGKCLECPECDEYETTGTASILCEYCGHRPVEHELIKSAEETTPAKKPRLEPIQEALEIDLGDGERQIESIDDEPGSVSSSVSLNTEILPTENSAASPSKPSATENYLPSPHRGTPEESVEVVEVVDVDTELEGQQMKAKRTCKERSRRGF